MSSGKAILILNSAKKSGVQISLKNGALQLKVSKAGASSQGIDASLLQDIKEYKDAIIEFLSNTSLQAILATPDHAIKPFDRNTVEHIPLSFSQERLWFIHQLDGSQQYHLPLVLKLIGNLNATALEQSLKTIIQRHEVLRSIIYQSVDGSFQRVMSASGWVMDKVNGFSFKNEQAELISVIRAIVTKPFDLTSDFMLRATIIELETASSVLVVTMHHIASDGWSLPIITSEVALLYQAFAAGSSPAMEPLAVQYADFAMWQRNYLQGGVMDDKINYWKKKLSGLATIQLPTDFKRPLVQRTNGASVSFTIEPELAHAIRQLSQQQGTTLFMTMLAAFKILLYRYSNQPDVCVGTPIAGRQQEELEGLCGFFVNTLVLRTEIDNNDNFITLLAKVKATTMEAYEHQEAPFEKIVEAVVKERDLSRSPLFQILFSMQHLKVNQQISLPGLTLENQAVENITSKFDLSFYITDSASSMECSVEYCTDIFEEKTIRQLCNNYTQILSVVIKHPKEKIDFLDILSIQEKRQLLQGFNESAVDYHLSNSLTDLFEKQATDKPNEIAVVFEGEQITYRELNEKSNKFAHYLISQGIKKESLVPVCIDRSPLMLVGLLGILKTGAAFVPIDPNYPQERISYMLSDISADLVVCSNKTRSKLEDSQTLQFVLLENTLDAFENHPVSNPITKVNTNQLAYIIYTSGSTGKPKGVMIEHASLINLITYIAGIVKFDSQSVFLSISTYSFDIAYIEFFMPLLLGGKVVLTSAETVMDGDLLKKKIAITAPTHLQATPATWQILLNDGWDNTESLKMIITGEAVKEDIKDALVELGDLYNCYGPTETTIWSTLKKLSSNEKVVIGKPVANTGVVIINKGGQLCPIGVSGEICISGAGLARGYYKNEALTQEKFTNNPFTNLPGKRLYHTGDLGRWLADGNIECFGRLDDQMKIRGFRIEPGEIETALEQLPFVQQAVVLTRDDQFQNKNLVGYIIPKEPVETEALIAALKSKLPAYMIPSRLVQMENFPLTPNGKVDRKALTAPTANSLIEKVYAAPNNELENSLQDLWQNLLGIATIGIHDNFFESGGHSLLAMRLVSAIRKNLGLELAIKDLFSNPTIETLAVSLSQSVKTTLLPSIILKERPARIPLSFSQERLWFIDQLEGSTQYHLPVILRLKGALDQSALAAAIHTIVERHEVLRTVIHQQDGVAYQLVQPVTNWHLAVEKIDDITTSKTNLYIQQLVNKPFNLAEDFMLRASLLLINKDEHVLIFVLHHIASDGWSMSVVVKEVMEVYQSGKQQRLPQLGALPIQYADYAIWQRNYLQGDVLLQKISYWKNKLDDVMPLQLPVYFLRPAIRNNAGARQSFSINKKLTDQLNQLSRQQDTTLFMTLLSVFKVLLHRYTGQQDICVGTPVANRTIHEVEELIGFFVNTLALRSSVADNMLFTDLLQAVKETVMEAYTHQDTPFEKVVDAVVTERDLYRTPIFQVLFVMQNAPTAPQLHINDLILTREDSGSHIAKFDITLTIIETADGLEAAFGYCTQLFRETTIRSMIAHFETLLVEIVEKPRQSIGLISMLSNAEKNQLLVEFNNSQVTYPADKTIVSLFEEQATKHPDRAALTFNGESISYRSLNEQANQLAAYLIDNGAGNESLIPLCFNRSADMLIALLGILKTGAAYVPIDPAYPADRIAWMLQDTGAILLLTTQQVSEQLALPANIIVINTDADIGKIQAYSNANPSLQISQQQLAYVIYTSGSTGTPKGVMIEHGALLDHCFGVIKSASLQHCSSFALFAPLVFDAGHSLIHASFLLAANMHVLSKQLLDDGRQLSTYIKSNTIDCIKIVPSLWLSYADAGSAILANKVMIFGGDSFSVNVLDHLNKLNYSGKVFNHYGPTETTIGKTIHEVNLQKKYVNIPIGKPFSNTAVFITNTLQQLIPIGVPGHLYIAGQGLATGYLNNTALTKEKFIPNPFVNTGYTRMYKTGDLARWLPDGNIEYLGRSDEQVKIRGFRIEPGEIESAIKESGMVQQSVVLAKTAAGGNKVLVAYIVTVKEFQKDTLITFLKSRLPDYMIPAFWIPMEQMPLTINGKINKKALPEPATVQLTGNDYTAPGAGIEQELANIWQALLGIEKIGVNDNFFELGGDSIISIQLVSRARQKGYELQVADIFTAQTIAKLALVIGQNVLKQSHTSGEQGLLSGNAGLLPVQQRFFEKTHTQINHFNQSVLTQIDKGIDQPMLNEVVSELISRHDALRFKYDQQNGQWQQVYGSKEAAVVVTDFSRTKEANWQQLVTEECNNQQHSLDITTGDLLRIVLIKTPLAESNNRLLVIIHHLVVDGVSMRILLNDLELLLTQVINKQPFSAATKTSSYRQWYHALEQYASGHRLVVQQPYWQQVIKNYQPFPSDYTTDEIYLAKNKTTYTISIDAMLSGKLLREAHRPYRTEINDLLLSALYITLRNWSSLNKIVIGLEGHGRQNIGEIDISHTVGWFTTHYPLLLQMPASDFSLADCIKSVKEQLRQVPDKGLGYGVMRYIVKEAMFQGKEPWDIVFNYFGRFDNILSADGLLQPAKESTGASISEAYEINEKIAINGFIQDGQLLLTWSYSKAHYNHDTIVKVAGEYADTLEKIITHCSELTEISPTPFDFGLSQEIEYRELETFLNEPVSDGSVRKDNLDGLYRLSGLQQGLLFHSLYDTNGGSYINQFTCELESPDLDLLKQSWYHVLQNHSILRTAIHHKSFAKPVQAFYRNVALPIKMLDYRLFTKDEQLEKIAADEISDKNKNVDFGQPPLMTLTFTQLNNQLVSMRWTWHHILFDGWSMPILMEEILTAYELLISNKPLPFIKQDNYEEYIRFLEERDKELERAYWSKYLKDLQQVTQLPFINSGGRTNVSGKHREVRLALQNETSDNIYRFVKTNHLTINTLVQGIWAYLLHQYTGSKSITFGNIVSGRPESLPNVEHKVGLFINTLPLYSNISENENIVTWLQQLQADEVVSRKFQYTPLSDIQSFTGITGSLFDTLMIFENYPVNKLIAERQWSLKVENVSFNEQTNYPLTIIVNVKPTEIVLNFGYNSNLLDEEYVLNISHHFENILLQIIQNSAQKIKELELLTDAEKAYLLSELNDTLTKYPAQKTIKNLFEEQVIKTPDNIAVVFENEQLTYRELNERSNQLCHYLKERDIGNESMVPICIDRSIEMIVGILGIIKAGAAYVPIDPDYPLERINYILNDISATVILTNKAADKKFKEVENINIIEIDTLWPLISNHSAIDPLTGPLASNLAYVIYTSGSTGKPKGVLIEHVAIVNRLIWAQEYYQLTFADIVLQKTSFCFDVSVWELFWPLQTGAKLVFARPDGHKDPLYLKHIIRKEGITMLHFVPSMLTVFLAEVHKNDCPTLKKVLCSGEALMQSQVSLFTQSLPGVELHNLYGPTEAAVDVTYWTLPSQSVIPSVVPIGKPVANTSIYILNEWNRLVPVGGVGEIVIGGVQVARGYLNLSEQTSEKFITDPFKSNGRAYKTGDLGRWMPDGNIEYLGRIDQQVKVNGFRIELSEIEKVLEQCDAVQKAVVMAVDDPQFNKQLIAYIVPEGVFDKELMIHFLETLLPSYMVPTLWVKVENLPLTSNGKIDRKALLNIKSIDLLTGAKYLAPRNPTEVALAVIWQRVLGIEQVGINDNFFELGGHSLLAMQVIAAMRKEMNIEFAIKIYFELNTIGKISNFIMVNTQHHLQVQLDDYEEIKL